MQRCSAYQAGPTPSRPLSSRAFCVCGAVRDPPQGYASGPRFPRPPGSCAAYRARALPARGESAAFLRQGNQRPRSHVSGVRRWAGRGARACVPRSRDVQRVPPRALRVGPPPRPPPPGAPRRVRAAAGTYHGASPRASLSSRSSATPALAAALAALGPAPAEKKYQTWAPLQGVAARAQAAPAELLGHDRRQPSAHGGLRCVCAPDRAAGRGRGASPRVARSPRAEPPSWAWSPG